ncbi:electron transport complex subunit RsxD [Celerinatantimonas sp. YJH-8]|uniref:electron transport complex subunit RsxD n=1 Tax=Celerinatantimonas sp. YJH-8 TaxID=3228714 RepID=UPI0038C628C8
MMLTILSSPFKHTHRSTPAIMAWVALAACPGIIAQWYFFGPGSFIQIVLCILTAWITEGIVLKLRNRSVLSTLRDHSALVTAILLGISIPGYAPWWVAVLGTIFAILLAKQLYGGLGQNIFNPAMAAYVFLLISFPVAMTGWIPPLSLIKLPLQFGDSLHLIFTGFTLDGFSLHQIANSADSISQATPLNALKTGITLGHSVPSILATPLFDSFAGIGWNAMNAGFLLGGLFLLWQRIIRWHIPVMFLATFAIFSLIGHWFAPEHIASPLVDLFSGATMLGAFFILTDPVTASTTPKGRLIYGSMIGALVFIIRHIGGYPDGVAFAVLIANMCVPLLDHLTQPRVYGHRGKSSHE